MKHSTSALKTLGAALALCAANAAAATLLVNGSFESGAFVSPFDQTMQLAPGSSVIDGWTVLTDTTAWIGSGNPFGLSASDGSRFLDLTNYQAGAPFAGMAQTIATTPGATYLLSFDLGSSNFWGRPSAIVASAAGTSATFISLLTGGNDDWTPESMQFIATSAFTTVLLQGSAGFNYIGLDNAAVVLVAGPGDPPPAIPEPGTWALTLGGLGLLGWGARRRGPAGPLRPPERRNPEVST